MRGVEAVGLEDRCREYVEQHIRAGVIEQGTVDLLDEMGVDERLRREGEEHPGIELRFDRKGHRSRSRS
jgi:p-hydroxybenzoate 3-monooxygenase